MAKPDHYFFALQPPEEKHPVLEQLCASLKGEVKEGSLVRPLDRRFYHLTLLPVEPELAHSGRLTAPVAVLAAEVPPFILSLDRTANVPAPRWNCWILKPSAAPPELNNLARDLRRKLAVARGDRPDEKPPPFSPHLTISYVASAALPATTITPVSWTVRELVLIHSYQDDSTRQHKVLARWPLSGTQKQIGLF